MNGVDTASVWAVARKEILDYRRKRAIVVTMCVMPVLFMIEPVVEIFLAPVAAGSGSDKTITIVLLYLLLTPVVMPSTLAAYAVTGEREQGTLEPLLTTPVRTQELILGKGAAVMIPTIGLSYVLYGVFLAAVRLFAHPRTSSVVFHDGPVLLALFLFAPLVAGWAVAAGLAVSVRASEVRVAQQLGMLASLPIVGVVVLFVASVVQPTVGVALEFALGLLAADLLMLRVVSRMFDRERLVTGAKAGKLRTTRASTAPVSAGPSAAGPATATATLELSRRRGGVVGRNWEWPVEIDGGVVGSVAGEGTVTFPIAPGTHTVRLGSHRRVSPERSFDAGDAEVVSFRCRGALVWPVWLAALIKPDLWISLKQE